MNVYACLYCSVARQYLNRMASLWDFVVGFAVCILCATCRCEFFITFIGVGITHLEALRLTWYFAWHSTSCVTVLNGEQWAYIASDNLNVQKIWKIPFQMKWKLTYHDQCYTLYVTYQSARFHFIFFLTFPQNFRFSKSIFQF